jgi:hypothetical protein
LANKYTHDLRAVQDLLGHADPRTTAHYSRVVDGALNNPAAAVPIRLRPGKCGARQSVRDRLVASRPRSRQERVRSAARPVSGIEDAF